MLTLLRPLLRARAPHLARHLTLRLLPLSAFSSVPPPEPHPLLLRLVEARTDAELEQPLSEMAKLNDQNREAALRIILHGISKRSFSPRMLVHEKLTLHLKRFPSLQVEAMLLRITQQQAELDRFIAAKREEGKRLAVKDINSCFAIVFAAVKRAPKDPLLEVRASRAFAHYHHKYLLRLVDSTKTDEVLKKAQDFYRNALSKLGASIEGMKDVKEDEEEEARLSGLSAEELEKEAGSGAFQRFARAEEFSEMVYQLMEVVNFLTDPRIRSRPQPTKPTPLAFQFHAGLFPLIPLFAQAVSHYTSPRACIQSSYYYKLRKTLLELEHYQALEGVEGKEGKRSAQERRQEAKSARERREEEVAAFDGRMDKLAAEVTANLESMPYVAESLDTQEEHCALLLGIYINRLGRLGLERVEFEKRLLEHITAILLLIKLPDVQRLIAHTFTHTIRRVLGLDFQPHLGRLPRSTRVPTNRPNPNKQPKGAKRATTRAAARYKGTRVTRGSRYAPKQEAEPEVKQEARQQAKREVRKK